MKLRWPYAPQPGPQTKLAKSCAANAPFTDIAYGGGKGSGKSFGARMCAFTVTWEIPITWTIIRTQFKSLNKNHIIPAKNELRDFINAGYIRYNSEEKIFYMPSGGMVVFAHCENESDAEQIQGNASDVFWFEEAGQFTEEIISNIGSSNRASDIAINRKARFNPRIFYTFNWGGKGHNFLRRKFWDKKYTEKEIPKNHLFFFATVFDNKILLDANPQYLQKLNELPKQLRQAYLEGDPDAFLGLMFNIIRPVHEVNPHELLRPYNGKIPKEWRLIGSLDSGVRCAYGHYAITPTGQRYKIFDYKPDEQKNPKEHVNAIKELIADCEWTDGRPPEYIVGDSYAFQKHEKHAIQSTDTTWEHLMRPYYMYRVKYNRVTAVEALQSSLHYSYADGSLTEVPELDEVPKLQFFEGCCENTVSELVSIPRDKNNPRDNAHGPNDEDHSIDETKNFNMTADAPPEIEKIEEEREQRLGYGHDQEAPYEAADTGQYDSFLGAGDIDDTI